MSKIINFLMKDIVLIDLLKDFVDLITGKIEYACCPRCMKNFNSLYCDCLFYNDEFEFESFERMIMFN